MDILEPSQQDLFTVTFVCFHFLDKAIGRTVILGVADHGRRFVKARIKRGYRLVDQLIAIMLLALAVHLPAAGKDLHPIVKALEGDGHWFCSIS